MLRSIAVTACALVALTACSPDEDRRSAPEARPTQASRPQTSPAVPKFRTNERFATRPAEPKADQRDGASAIREAVSSVPGKDVPAVMMIVSCMSKSDAGPYDPQARAARIRKVASDLAAGRRIPGPCADVAPGSLKDRLRP